MARLVKDDFEFQGCPMKKDDWIFLSFPAANRDPKAFDNADEVLIDREINRHSAFGLGIHRCLGSNLARMEMTVALEEWLKRYTKFELDTSKPTTFSQGQVRGPRQLPLRILERN
jgi:cytochrome P450